MAVSVTELRKSYLDSLAELWTAVAVRASMPSSPWIFSHARIVTASSALFEFTGAAKVRNELKFLNVGLFAEARDRLRDVIEGRELPVEVLS